MVEKKSEIKISYSIKKIEQEEKDVIMILDPVEKQQLPEDQLHMSQMFSDMLGIDMEETKQIQKLSEQMLKGLNQVAGLYRIEISLDQLKNLKKTIGDKVTVTIQ